MKPSFNIFALTPVRVEMTRLVDAVHSGVQPFLWLDSDVYAARLFGNEAPWLDIAGLVAWRGKAQHLLRSDVVTLPLDAVCRAWLSMHADLGASMASKSRTLFPLKTLLGDETLRTHLVDLAGALRNSFDFLSFVIVAPSPRNWAAFAHQMAHGDDEIIGVDDDDADSAGVYVADFLRAFSSSGIDALLLDESHTASPTSVHSLMPYQATMNVAAHYRWDIGLRVTRAAEGNIGEAGVGFAIAPDPCAVATGIATQADFWSGQPLPALPPGAFRYADLPASIPPEQALERVAALRATS